MFGQSVHGFRVVTSLDGVSGSLIQTSFSGVCDSRRRMKFRLTVVTMVSLYIVVALVLRKP